AYIEAHAVLSDSLLNYETVKYFNAEPVICNRYGDTLIQQESATRAVLSQRARNSIMVSIIYALSLGLSLGFAGYEVMQGNMTAGDFVLINSYIVRLMQPLQTIGVAIRDISEGLAYVQKMLEMFHEPREAGPADSRAASFESRGSLKFEHVSFS